MRNRIEAKNFLAVLLSALILPLGTVSATESSHSKWKTFQRPEIPFRIKYPSAAKVSEGHDRWYDSIVITNYPGGDTDFTKDQFEIEFMIARGKQRVKGRLCPLMEGASKSKLNGKTVYRTPTKIAGEGEASGEELCYDAVEAQYWVKVYGSPTDATLSKAIMATLQIAESKK